MKITRLTAVGILAAFMLISCSSIAPLSEEEAALLVEGTVFEPDETEKTVYVPVETVRYIVTDSDNSTRTKNDNTTDIPEDETTKYWYRIRGDVGMYFREAAVTAKMTTEEAEALPLESKV